MASRPPRTTRTRRYVSHHAIERLRERAEVSPQLGDDDLARILDDAVWKAVEGGRFDEVRDSKGDPAKLVDVGADLDDLVATGDVFALVKDNSAYDGGRPECVVTVVGDQAAARIRATADPPEDEGGSGSTEGPFNSTLAEQIAEVRLPSGGTARPLSTAPRDRLVAAGLLEPGKAPEEGDARYLVVDGGTLLTREEAVERLRGNTALRLFRRVDFRVRVEFDD